MATGETAWTLGPSPNEPPPVSQASPALDDEVTIADLTAAIPLRLWRWRRKAKHRDE